MRPAPVLIRVPKPDSKHPESRAPAGARRAWRKSILVACAFGAFIWVPIVLVLGLRLLSGKGFVTSQGVNMLAVILPIPVALTAVLILGLVSFRLLSRRRSRTADVAGAGSSPSGGRRKTLFRLRLFALLVTAYVVFAVLAYRVANIVALHTGGRGLFGLSAWQVAFLAPLAFGFLIYGHMELIRMLKGVRDAAPPGTRALDTPEERPEPPPEVQEAPASPSAAAAALARLWDVKDRPPTIGEVESVLRTSGADDAAQVVCLSYVPVSEVGELRFEPEIVAPSSRVPFGVGPIVAGIALLIGWWGLWRLGVLATAPSGFGWPGLVLVGIPSVAIWVWHGVVRPRYVRLAPGIIQVLQYSWLGASRPSIRSYPMLPGTIAVVRRRNPRAVGIVLDITRDGQSDRISFSDVSDAEHATERMWQALLSTAPIPDLPDDRLIG